LLFAFRSSIRESIVSSNNQNAALTQLGNLEQGELISSGSSQVSEDHNAGKLSEPQSINNIDIQSWFSCFHEMQSIFHPPKESRSEHLAHTLQLAMVKLAPSPHPDLLNIFSSMFHPIPAVVAVVNHIGALGTGPSQCWS
jgi:hypothetical protein